MCSALPWRSFPSPEHARAAKQTGSCAGSSLTHRVRAGLSRPQHFSLWVRFSSERFLPRLRITDPRRCAPEGPWNPLGGVSTYSAGSSSGQGPRRCGRSLDAGVRCRGLGGIRGIDQTNSEARLRLVFNCLPPRRSKGCPDLPAVFERSVRFLWADNRSGPDPAQC